MTTTPSPLDRAAESPVVRAARAYGIARDARFDGFGDTWDDLDQETRDAEIEDMRVALAAALSDVEGIARELARHASLVGVPDEGTECECGDVITEDPEFYAVSAWREHQARAVVAHLTGATR